MSGHEYGRQGPYHNIPPQQYQNYVRSPPRRPVAPYARQPARGQQPQYQEDGGSYAAYRPQPPTHSDQDYHDPAVAGTGAAGVTPYDSAPHANGRRPSVGDEHGQRYDSPSRNPFSDPYSSENLPRPGHQPSNSQSSLPEPPRHGAGMSGAGDLGYGYGQGRSMPSGRQPYCGDGYDEYMDPRDIADDPDDTYDVPPQRPKSRFGIAAAGTGAAAGGATHVLQALGQRDPSGNYGPVGGNSGGAEKSEWLKSESSARMKRKWIAIGILLFIVLGAIAGGLAYYFISRKDGSSSSGRGSSSSTSSNGLWGLKSPEVQAVLKDKNLHKVFPGMDYTPYGAQYPACLSNMPYQNDVTVDVAVLAQLTPAIRLYGTDCEQTEMVLKGIDLLGYNDTIKVWLGVYLDGNSTTNDRQLNQIYDILDKYPSSHFAGVIVGNEVLFSEFLTEPQLANYLTKVRQELSSRGISLPVSTADLGDNWTAGLAADSDIIMANVHPFFAGRTPSQAPGWTLNFWNTHDVVLKSTSNGPWPANIISETGWPTQGGNDCGTGAKCASKTEGAIAGIDELNQYMDGWVCQRLEKGDTYFWFEAFDEPWKHVFDNATTGDFWEPYWGLFDSKRNLKDGVKIPDCGGKTVNKPY